MADKFTEALEELKDALTNGEELEAALATVAADHDLRPEALRNRATLAWGDLAALGEKLSSNAAVGARKALAAQRYARYKDISSRLEASKAPTKEEEQWMLWYWGETIDEDLKVLNQN
jgi:hypothetical protein